MNFFRGSLATSAANDGLTTSIAIMVPVKSHGRFLIPPAIPASSRIGRRMK